MSEDEEEVGKSSPRQHCPQKAVAAQAATAASSGELRSRTPTSCAIIFALTGGAKGLFGGPRSKVVYTVKNVPET